MVLKMETRYKFTLLGIYCVLLNYGLAQKNIPNGWCDNVTVNTYIRNASDCRQWIRCNGENPPTWGFCPNPSFFSFELQRCTSESAAKCFVCPNATSTSVEAAENSCKRYIRCVDGVPAEFMCGAGMVFNSETNRCESEFFQACTISSTTTPIGISSIITNTIDGKISTITSTVKATRTTTEDPIETTTVHSTTFTPRATDPSTIHSTTFTPSATNPSTVHSTTISTSDSHPSTSTIFYNFI